MDIESFSLDEFLGILFIGLPVLVFLAFELLQFIAEYRENFNKNKSVFHHHFHYKALK